MTGHGACEQCLARTRRTHEQHTLRQAAAQTAELLRVLQEFDDLLQFCLGLVRAGHVGERDLRRVTGQQPRLRLAELECFRAARLH